VESDGFTVLRVDGSEGALFVLVLDADNGCIELQEVQPPPPDPIPPTFARVTALEVGSKVGLLVDVGPQVAYVEMREASGEPLQRVQVVDGTATLVVDIGQLLVSHDGSGSLISAVPVLSPRLEVDPAVGELAQAAADQFVACALRIGAVPAEVPARDSLCHMLASVIGERAQVEVTSKEATFYGTRVDLRLDDMCAWVAVYTGTRGDEGPFAVSFEYHAKQC